MDEKQATEILTNDTILSNGSLEGSFPFPYLSWRIDNEKATLDGEFTANELEAIAWWMKNKIG